MENALLKKKIADIEIAIAMQEDVIALGGPFLKVDALLKMTITDFVKNGITFNIVNND